MSFSVADNVDTGDIAIRPVSTIAELEACVQLQIATWGYDAADVVPRKLFSLATHIGGQVLGAFQRERLVGFLLALPGVRNGNSYLHSHMLAVVPELRNAGLGRRMKVAQRDDALARGIDLIEWTFDPLEAKNAFLNLNKLGAIARRYAPDFYGPSTSPLQGGLPTDRLYAEWWLRSDRVMRALAGEANVAGAGGEVVRVTLPGELPRWKETAAGRREARAVQQGNEAAFQTAFAQGLCAFAFRRLPAGGGQYLLCRWPDEQIL